MRQIAIIFLLFSSWISYSQISTNSSKTYRTEVNTKFGKLTFNQFCTENTSSLSLIYDYQNLDPNVEEESETKKIGSDTVIVEIIIDDYGYITNFKILKNGLLKEFTSFVNEMFAELKSEMPKQNQPLKCNMKKGKYVLPVKYNYN